MFIKLGLIRFHFCGDKVTLSKFKTAYNVGYRIKNTAKHIFRMQKRSAGRIMYGKVDSKKYKKKKIKN